MDNVFDPALPKHGVFKPSLQAAAHLKVLRLRAMQQVGVLDGCGGSAVCSVSSSGMLEVVDYTYTPKPPNTILAMAHLHNRDRMEFAIEKAAELGCTRFVPLTTAFVQRARTPHARMQAKAQAALTQSGAAWLMDIAPTQSLAEFLGILENDTQLFVGNMHGANPTAEAMGNANVAVVIGPEGGLDHVEMRLLAERGAIGWSLSKTRLRSETAAVCFLSVVSVLRVMH